MVGGLQQLTEKQKQTQNETNKKPQAHLDNIASKWLAGGDEVTGSTLQIIEDFDYAIQCAGYNFIIYSTSALFLRFCFVLSCRFQGVAVLARAGHFTVRSAKPIRLLR